MDTNVFLIDWLTFTVKGSSVDQVKSLIGLVDQAVHWEVLGGCNGYPQSEFYAGVRIMYGASDEMGICCNMSGQGCRSFETFGMGDWIKLFDILVSLGDNINITRCDLAFDDHTGILDIERIQADTNDGHYTAKFRWWKCEYGSAGTSLYYGSPQSKIRLRIYDKAAERGFEDLHWIRVEVQLRDGNADSAVRYLYSGMAISTVFTGVLRNYIQFREPNDLDSNKSRWPMADYWAKFLDGAAPLTLWVKPGVEYNLFNLQRFVIEQAGNAISCYVAIYGFAGLADRLSEFKPMHKLPAKYQLLLDLAAREGGGVVYDEAMS